MQSILLDVQNALHDRTNTFCRLSKQLHCHAEHSAIRLLMNDYLEPDYGTATVRKCGTFRDFFVG